MCSCSWSQTLSLALCCLHLNIFRALTYWFPSLPSQHFTHDLHYVIHIKVPALEIILLTSWLIHSPTSGSAPSTSLRVLTKLRWKPVQVYISPTKNQYLGNHWLLFSSRWLESCLIQWMFTDIRWTARENLLLIRRKQMKDAHSIPVSPCWNQSWDLYNRVLLCLIILLFPMLPLSSTVADQQTLI